MTEATPSDVAKRLFGLLRAVTERKNETIIATTNPNRPKLSITKQTDDPNLPGTFQIAVSYPASSTDAIQTHHVAKITVHLEGGGIDLTLGRAITAKRYTLANCPDIFKEVREAIDAY